MRANKSNKNGKKQSMNSIGEKIMQLNVSIRNKQKSKNLIKIRK